jgi:hypothetical protein
MVLDISLNDRVTIHKDAIVSQDFTTFLWGKPKIEFRVRMRVHCDRVMLVADGYGELGPHKEYGNGAIFVDIEDLDKVEKS